MVPIQVKFRRVSQDVLVPKKQTPGSGAYDIHAFLGDQQLQVAPGEVKAVPTGLSVELPEGYVLSLRPRSGLAFNHAVTLINSPGTVDSDYRGEIRILVINHGTMPFVIKNGDRVAQLILEKTFSIEWTETDALADSARGENGFGSTGKQ